MSSLTDFAGTDGFITRNSGAEEASTTGAKSLIVSNAKNALPFGDGSGGDMEKWLEGNLRQYIFASDSGRSQRRQGPHDAASLRAASNRHHRRSCSRRARRERRPQEHGSNLKNRA